MKQVVSLILLVFLSVVSAGFAQDTKTPGIESVQILQGWRQANGTHMSALHIVLEPDFKTYWRAPGSSGIPVSIDFSGSRNFDGAELHWPTPELFSVSGVQTLGYENELILPFTVNVKRMSGPVAIKARVHMGVCSDICVPVQVNLKGFLTETVKKNQQGINASLNNQPMTGIQAGIQAITCDFMPIEDGFVVRANTQLPKGMSVDFVTLEMQRKDVWIEKVKFSQSGNKLIQEVPVYVYADGAVLLDRQNFRFTLFTNKGAVDIQGCTGG